MTIKNQKIVNRWNSVMNSIGCEHLTVDTYLSELERCKDYYNIKEGISLEWMLEEAEYWLSCYYESGNVRCDDRYENKECYSIWVSETGMLKRLIGTLKKLNNEIIVEW